MVLCPTVNRDSVDRVIYYSKVTQSTRYFLRVHRDNNTEPAKAVVGPQTATFSKFQNAPETHLANPGIVFSGSVSSVRIVSLEAMHNYRTRKYRRSIEESKPVRAADSL